MGGRTIGNATVACTTGFHREAALAGLLPRFSDFLKHRLMALTAAKGHPDLKLSFAQVLSAIGPQGGRIQQMAELQGVTKQAISAIAVELEDLGGRTRMVLTHIGVPADSPGAAGWNMALDKLGARVAELSV